MKNLHAKEIKAFVPSIEDMPYGVREFGVKDYDEYSLAFAQRI